MNVRDNIYREKCAGPQDTDNVTQPWSLVIAHLICSQSTHQEKERDSHSSFSVRVKSTENPFHPTKTSYLVFVF